MGSLLKDFVGRQVSAMEGDVLSSPVRSGGHSGPPSTSIIPVSIDGVYVTEEGGRFSRTELTFAAWARPHVDALPSIPAWGELSPCNPDLTHLPLS